MTDRTPHRVRNTFYLMTTPEYPLHTRVKKITDVWRSLNPYTQLKDEIESYRKYLHGIGEPAPRGYVVRRIPRFKKYVGYVYEEKMLNEELGAYDKYRESMAKFPDQWYR